MKLTSEYKTVAKRGIRQASEYEDNILIPDNTSISFEYQGFRNNHLRISLDGERRFIYAPHFNLNGVDLYQPESLVPNLTLDDTKWFNQRDNKIRPTGTCNTSSMAVVFNYLLGMSGKNTAQLEDILSQQMLDMGLNRTWHEHLAKLARRHGLKDRFVTNCSFKTARKQLALGIPVVISGRYTRSGHIVCLVGYTPNSFIVQDPWGDKNTNYSSHNGKFVEYSLSLLEKVSYNDEIGWAHLFGNPNIDRLITSSKE